MSHSSSRLLSALAALWLIVGGAPALAHDDMTAYRRRLEDEVAQRRATGIGAPGETADVATFLPDLCGPTQFQRLADLLAARGHHEARIEKILGGNFRRLMADAWTHS